MILYIFAFLMILIGLELIAHVSNRNYKQYFVLGVSIILIMWLDIYSFMLLFIYSSIIIFVIKQRLSLFNNVLYFVIINVLFLIIIKDYYLLFDMQKAYIPLGVSYYFFRLISFVIDYSKAKEQYENIPLLDYYTYVFFFPIFLAGPIQRFRDFKILDKEIVSKQKIKNYYLLFGAIFLKLLFVDNLLYSLAYEHEYKQMLIGLNQGILNKHLIFFGFSSFFHAYLDLMLYTEISKSLAGILGFSKQENFNKPLLATNISKFWQSWHMSLSNWTRDYVFFPTLLKTKKVWISTYASMLMIGIWHSISFSWLFWAFMHGSALNFYLYFRNTKIFLYFTRHKALNLILKVLGNVVTITFVSMIFIVVALHNDILLKKIFTIVFNF